VLRPQPTAPRRVLCVSLSPKRKTGDACRLGEVSRSALGRTTESCRSLVPPVFGAGGVGAANGLMCAWAGARAKRHGTGMSEDIRYRLADYDGGLEAHPVPERAGELRLVGSWWELRFKHTFEIANGELTDYLLEALAVDDKSCLVSIRDGEGEREILCSFVLPATSAGRFSCDLDERLRELAAAAVEAGAESGRGSPDWGQGDGVATDFPVRMQPSAGERLEIVPCDAGSSWSKLGLGARSRLVVSGAAPLVPDLYELRSPGGLVGLLAFGGEAGLASMAGSDGSWSLKKRHRIGWDLDIESPDGHQIGSYSGRRWLPGGTISLIDGPHVDLRRVINGHHMLRVVGERDWFLDIRTSGSRTGLTMAIAVLSTPMSTTECVVVTFTACAVLVLDMSGIRIAGVGG